MIQLVIPGVIGSYKCQCPVDMKGGGFLKIIEDDNNAEMPVGYKVGNRYSGMSAPLI